MAPAFVVAGTNVTDTLELDPVEEQLGWVGETLVTDAEDRRLLNNQLSNYTSASE